MFSMNVHIPRNKRPGDGPPLPNGAISPFNYFAGIVVAIFLVACCMVTVIRWWRWKARQKWAGIRKAEVPDWWEGYWGWS